MAEGFGQYVGVPPRMRELKRRIDEEGARDPEDLMLIITDVLKEEVLYPEPGKFYTFIYNPKTPNISYDQNPLVAVTEVYKWGFKAINFHWGQLRQYTWSEVAGQLYEVYSDELADLREIPFANIRLNS